MKQAFEKIQKVIVEDLEFSPFPSSQDDTFIFAKLTDDYFIEYAGTSIAELQSSHYFIIATMDRISINLKIWDNCEILNNYPEIKIVGAFPKEVKIPEGCSEKTTKFLYEIFGRIASTMAIC